MNKKKNSRLEEAILETAEGMWQRGILDKSNYEKITKRHVGHKEPPKIESITGIEIRSIREQAHLSQAVFAGYLNLTVGYISQLERGIKQPSGAALVLFNLIRRKGIGAIL